MDRFRTFLEFLRVLRRGEYTGDAVILKVATFGGFNPSASAEACLAKIPKHPPDFSRQDFSAFPPGSFGRAYHEFMARNRLKVFRFSGKYQELLERHFLAVWYAAVHDMVHVLTGFETDLAGEAGVWSFIDAQGISPQSGRAVKLARLLYPLIRPGQRGQILEAIVRGRQMGLRARSILEIDFAKLLSFPLASVRADCAIAVADSVRASK